MTRSSSLSLPVAATLAGMLAITSPPAFAGAPSFAERAHASAVGSFRQGRFPEAYGRFIRLAEAGHPASARYAIWMCMNGLELFGRDWDCSQQEVDDWARTAGVAPPRVLAGPTTRYLVKR